MCGICGIYTLDGSDVPQVLDAMNDSLVHRGPDDSGTYFNGRAGVGMRRLSVIGLDNGHQPLFNEDGTVAVVMNGEIYNYRELKQDLVSRGHRFATESDVEVVPHLYEELGEGFVEPLRGMFAIALWDSSKQRLLAVRDRPGKKPLYWSEHDGHVLLASEIKAIHASGLVPKELDPSGLRAYLSLGYVPGSATLFRHIQKVPAGHMLELEGGRCDLHRYWDLPRRPSGEDPPALDEAAERIRFLLEEGVRKRLMSDVPLGAFLSGGIDSSAIVAIMRRHFDHPLQTFSVGFSSERFDESHHARQVSELYGTDHHEFLLRGCNLELLRDINHYYDEPAGDPAAVPTFCLAKFARRRVTVALTGEGGDETFAGYPHHGHCLRIGALEGRVPGLRAAARLAAGLEPVARRLLSARFWKGAWLVSLPAEERARAWGAAFTDREMASLLTDDTALETPVGGLGAPFRELQARVADLDPLAQLLYVDSMSGLADQLLMKVDKMGMAASLEARCPLLDQDLVEYAASLPSSMKRSKEGSKVVFRLALRGLIPDEILDRPKQGFDVPLDDWLLRDLVSLVDRLLLADDAPVHRWLKRSAIRRLWNEFSAERHDRLAFQLWRLLNLAVWLELHWPSSRLEELARAPENAQPLEALFVETVSG